MDVNILVLGLKRHCLGFFHSGLNSSVCALETTTCQCDDGDQQSGLMGWGMLVP